MIEEKIVIDNLKCGGCVNTVTKKLLAIEGVQTVEVDLATSTVLIQREEKVSRENLQEILTKWGYPESGTSNLFQKATSYVSCAIGRLDKK